MFFVIGGLRLGVPEARFDFVNNTQIGIELFGAGIEEMARPVGPINRRLNPVTLTSSESEKTVMATA